MADTPPRTGTPQARNPGPGSQIRKRAAALTPKKADGAAGGGGGQSSSTNTMMRLYTQDEAQGLKVDPVIVLVLAVVFVFSVVSLHLITKVARYFTK